MVNPHLATYLNDHLAGATGTPELLEHLKDATTGRELQGICAELYVDVTEDRDELETLMLVQRAIDQRGCIEKVRLQTARAAFRGTA